MEALSRFLVHVAGIRIVGNALLTSHVRLLRIDAWRLDMKALLYSGIFALLVSTPVFSADSVSLVGTWTGQRDRIAKVEDGAVVLRRWS
jgi:hypothetical protein